MIRESGIAKPEFGIPRCAHGAGILRRKTLRDQVEDPLAGVMATMGDRERMP